MSAFAPRLTFSGLPATELCPPRAVLPGSKSHNRYTRTGNVIHDYLRDCNLLGSSEAALLRVALEHRAAMEKLPISKLPLDPTAYTPELALAYNVHSQETRVLGINISRGYPDLGEGWIYGTLDVAGEMADAVIDLDYKSGWGDLDPAKEHLQVLAGGLALARARNKDAAIVGLVRIPDSGSEPWADRARLDAIDLDAVAFRLEQIYERAITTAAEMEAGTWSGDVYEGEHCARCPGYARCPAKQVLARMVVLAAEGNISPLTPQQVRSIEEVGSHLTEQNAPMFLRQLDRAEEMIERLRSVLKDWAREHPIPAEKGKVYGAYPHLAKEDIDVERSRGVLVPLYGPAVYEASIRRETRLDKGQLEESVKDWARRNDAPLGKTYAAALDALRTAGAALPHYSHPVGYHKPRANKEV